MQNPNTSPFPPSRIHIYGYIYANTLVIKKIDYLFLLGFNACMGSLKILEENDFCDASNLAFNLCL